MDVVLNDNSAEWQIMFNNATNLISQGKNQEGMGLIMSLCQQNKVAIIPVTVDASVSGQM